MRHSAIYRSTISPRVLGHSLLELGAAVAILAILSVSALPGLRNLAVEAQQRAHGNAFIDAVRFARETAASTGEQIIVCPRKENITCGDNWNSGWGVFHLTADKTKPLREYIINGSAIRVNANRQKFVFQQHLRATNGTIKFCSERLTNYLNVIVSYTGKTTLTKTEAGGCY
ncbi:MAG: GspH/FimT family pseudopilin [Gammaproteobacteria bacterium]|nr:GspH/FimT family pseudopilin [Gammaproteobacteria bacterium]